mgnify:CR=1 FL=1
MPTYALPQMKGNERSSESIQMRTYAPGPVNWTVGDRGVLQTPDWQRRVSSSTSWVGACNGQGVQVSAMCKYTNA